MIWVLDRWRDALPHRLTRQPLSLANLFALAHDHHAFCFHIRVRSIKRDTWVHACIPTSLNAHVRWTIALRDFGDAFEVIGVQWVSRNMTGCYSGIQTIAMWIVAWCSSRDAIANA